MNIKVSKKIKGEYIISTLDKQIKSGNTSLEININDYVYLMSYLQKSFPGLFEEESFKKYKGHILKII